MKEGKKGFQCNRWMSNRENGREKLPLFCLQFGVINTIAPHIETFIKLLPNIRGTELSVLCNQVHIIL